MSNPRNNLAGILAGAPRLIRNRINRANLDKNKCYIQVKTTDGMEQEEYVGRFVRTYRMGSGDGTQLFVEFNDNGRFVTIEEEMWGHVNGAGLSYFLEAECKAKGGKRKTVKNIKRKTTKIRKSRRNTNY